jgi:ABC-type sugar transport system ATPase subunit
VVVSHRLGELFAVADHITVLRNGETVASRPTAGYDEAALVRDILGHEPEEFTPAPTVTADDRPALRVRGLEVDGAAFGVDLDVRPGEIVGLAGLAGAGRSEILEAIFGLHPGARGTVEAGGLSTVPSGPIEAMSRGLALVPADRKGMGLVLGMSVLDNLMLADTASSGRLRHLSRRREIPVAASIADRLHVRCGDLGDPVSTLSGGNQQKVLLARWLQTKPDVLLLDDPTRGVDIGSKVEIHRLLTRARDDGASAVVTSSELEELLTLCDRFVVLFLGRVVGRLSRQEATESRIAHLASGGSVA